MVVRLPQHCFCHSVAVVCPDSATDAPPCNAYDPSWLGSPFSRFGQGEFQDMRWILGGGWARRDLARCGLSRVQENKLHTERASAWALFTLMTLGAAITNPDTKMLALCRMPCLAGRAFLRSSGRLPARRRHKLWSVKAVACWHKRRVFCDCGWCCVNGEPVE